MITIVNPSTEALLGDAARVTARRADRHACCRRSPPLVEEMQPRPAAPDAAADPDHPREARSAPSTCASPSEQARSDERDLVITLDDITDLVSAQRTSAWADVARRIAHEIKNPLTPIQLSAERIRRKYGKVITTDREVFDQCTDTIVRQVDDIKRMVDEFSSFARMPKPTIEQRGSGRDGPPGGVHDADRASRTSSSSTELPAGPGRRAVRPPAVVAGGHEHRQERHGSDRGRARGGARARRRSRWRSTRRHPDYLIIDVTDNGKGFPVEGRQRLLEPYMTTREGGTGLGLADRRQDSRGAWGRHGACRQSRRPGRSGSHVDPEDEA